MFFLLILFYINFFDFCFVQIRTQHLRATQTQHKTSELKRHSIVQQQQHPQSNKNNNNNRHHQQQQNVSATTMKPINSRQTVQGVTYGQLGQSNNSQVPITTNSAGPHPSQNYSYKHSSSSAVATATTVTTTNSENRYHQNYTSTLTAAPHSSHHHQQQTNYENNNNDDDNEKIRQRKIAAAFISGGGTSNSLSISKSLLAYSSFATGTPSHTQPWSNYPTFASKITHGMGGIIN